MHKFLKQVRKQVRKSGKRIVFPEGKDPRVVEAVKRIKKLKIAEPIIIKNTAKLPHLEEFAEALYKLRKHKGLTLAQAKKLVRDPNYYATMMLQLGHADGIVTGATYHTDDAIRPALQIIKTKQPFHKVSGVFFMVLEKRLLLFADCAVNINPTATELRDIAIDTAETAQCFGIKPRVALLSFSTKGSADHPNVDKMRKAVKLIKKKRPKLQVDGELQVDAALVPEVAKHKCPQSPLKGDANVLIFPDLESANIAYKLVERLAKAKAVGPVLQGLKKPVNDLSRGCSTEDIVNLTALTARECQ